MEPPTNRLEEQMSDVPIASFQRRQGANGPVGYVWGNAGYALEYAALELQSDREVVLVAVETDGN
eukprot:1133429-Amphidinium_carterae.1